MSTDTAPTRDELRQRVYDLIADGLSNRAIARRLPVGKDTVRRWRTEATAARATTPPGAPTSAPDAPPAHGGAPRDAPPAPAARTTPPSDGPPAHATTALGDLLTVPVDADLRDDLAVLAEAGHDPQHAVAHAVRLLADAYRYAWDYDMYDRGHRPRVHVRVIGGGNPPPRTRTAAHPNGVSQ